MPEISDTTPFRLAEKYYKSRQPPLSDRTKIASDATTTQHRRRRVRAARLLQETKPCLAGRGVLNVSPQPDDEIVAAGWDVDEDGLGGRQVKRIRLKGLDKDRDDENENETAQEGFVLADGIILLPSYLSSLSQLHLLQLTLSEYTLPPNPLSLSTHYVLPSLSSESFFDLYAGESETLIPSVAEILAQSSNVDAPLSSIYRQDQQDQQDQTQSSTSRSTPTPTPTTLSRSSSWKNDKPSPNLCGKTASVLMKELRWCNLGHVYNWTNKAYDFSHNSSIKFPDGLAKICRDVVRRIPWEEVFDGDDGTDTNQVDWKRWDDDYTPDTGIVNYYQLKDTLMGHVDRAEVDPYRPLISLSLGHASIFLLGSTTRDTEPIPVILRSGDVLVMSGKGRRFYHGVPRIMEGTLPRHFQPSQEDDCTMTACKRFISTARINVNARQVFPSPATSL